jgi:ribosomal protein S18 acetylase RimI-like enzyme
VIYPGEAIGFAGTMDCSKNDTRFDIRPLREDELDEMTSVWTDAGLPYRSTGRDSLDELRVQLKRDPDLFLGAFDGRRMIGAVIATDDGRKGWINRLAVLPSHRRMGVGEALVKVCEEALRKRGRGVVSILIEGRNAASEGLFLKSGYRDESYIRYYVKRDSEET